VTKLPTITDEDRAVYEEALRLWDPATNEPTTGEIAAALVRTGWKKVDEDLILAREVAAGTWYGLGTMADAIRNGEEDDHSSVRAALAAIKAADARRRGDG
jgi:hypothetical protein